MTDINQSIFIRALRRQPVERTPVWIMRQAGRYLPEYRALRQKAGDFLNLCKTPEWACEVTLQPLRRYPLDAAILFSDILTIPDAMGLGLFFAEGEGPVFRHPLRDLKAIQALVKPDVRSDLGYVTDAVRLIRKEMPAALPLIGFSGSPWTLACYMVEGCGSRDFRKVLKLLYSEPQTLHQLLMKLADAVYDYLAAQIEAGVNTVMLFDTWGGILTPDNYRQFSLAYMARIVDQLKAKYPQWPIIIFTKGGGQWLSAMAATGCDALGIDWSYDLAKARREVGSQVALQGNLDPAVLLTNPDCIRQQVQNTLAAFGYGSGHIFNLGHGITPDVPPENMAALVEAVHQLSPHFHRESDDH